MAARRPDPPASARLACGCAVTFRATAPGAPVVVFVSGKGTRCGVAFHVAGTALYDHREAIRPATRPLDPPHIDFEEEG